MWQIQAAVFLGKATPKVRGRAGVRVEIWEWPYSPKFPGRGKVPFFLAIDSEAIQGSDVHFSINFRGHGGTLTWPTDNLNYQDPWKWPWGSDLLVFKRACIILGIIHYQKLETVPAKQCHLEFVCLPSLNSYQQDTKVITIISSLQREREKIFEVL